MKKLLYLLFCGLLSLGFSLTLSLDQPSIHLETDRGSSVTHKINLYNQNDKPLKLKIYVRDWEYTESGAKAFLKSGSADSSCADWLKLSADSITLPANSEEEYAFTLKTPKDAEGGHQAVIFFETDADLKGRVQYGARIGALIYQKTKKHTQEYLEPQVLKNISNREGYAYELSFRNSGNAWNSAGGRLDLIIDGDAVEQIDLPQTGLLPNETVRYAGVFEQPFSSGRAEVLYTIEDAGGALLTGQLLSTEAAQDISDAELWIESFEPEYSKAKRTLQVRCQVAALEYMTVKPVVYIFTADTNKRVKTVEYNSRRLTPNKTETMTVSWPIGLPGSIPPGRYMCVLEIKKGAEVISAKRTIRID
ncbi:hypothetical protein HP1_116 [Candidatus Termititenax spirochaetophilus]|uniref:Uncharacterized protein n=1 Tax=Candidatus Termititenax spirochaetophilus TaxID=2218522 RepID=A0A388T8F1_9BACT|nr:hypothetical protein HP1_116 [Candidatus Termititenax spirochaetophilus]